MGIINPLIEPIARDIYRTKKVGGTSIRYNVSNPDHIEVEHAITHFNTLPHTKAVLKLSPYGKYYINVTWLVEE